MDYKELMTALMHYIGHEHIREIPRGEKGVIIGTLNRYCGGDEGRYALLSKVYGVKSTKELEDWQWAGLWDWMGIYKDELSGKWDGKPELREEINVLMQGHRISKPKTLQDKLRPKSEKEKRLLEELGF